MKILRFSTYTTQLATWDKFLFLSNCNRKSYAVLINYLAKSLIVLQRRNKTLNTQLIKINNILTTITNYYYLSHVLVEDLQKPFYHFCIQKDYIIVHDLLGTLGIT